MARFHDFAGAERLGRVKFASARQRRADSGNARQGRAQRQAEARAEQVAAVGAALVSYRHRCLLARFNGSIGSRPMLPVLRLASSESR